MDYNEEQIARIAENVKIVNKTITDYYFDLLDYVIKEVIDRALLYLNHEDLDVRFERVIVNIVDGIFRKYKISINNGEVEMGISSASDNGQSVSYFNEVKNYLTTASDNELFGGFVSLLSRYRSIKVVTSERV